MSHRTRTVLSTVGLALSAIGTAMVTLANTGCAGGNGEYGLKADITGYKRPPSVTTPAPESQSPQNRPQ